MANRRPDDYVSATSAAFRMGVSTRTLRRYTQEGRLPDARSAGGRRIFRIADLDAIGRKPPVGGGRTVGYARVSSLRQQAEGDLDQQVAGLNDFGGADLVVFTDVASGLSDCRAGLRKALSECMKPAVTGLLVEHPDRLARFGVGVIEQLLAGHRVSVTYSGLAAEDESAESELVRDMLAIVASFAGRLYGQRSAKTKRLRATVAAETETGSDAA